MPPNSAGGPAIVSNSACCKAWVRQFRVSEGLLPIPFAAGISELLAVRKAVAIGVSSAKRHSPLEGSLLKSLAKGIQRECASLAASMPNSVADSLETALHRRRTGNTIAVREATKERRPGLDKRGQSRRRKSKPGKEGTAQAGHWRSLRGVT
eukprot:CAMPEP_0170597026 /NCGR_PEP_ID=MMETSP0224-20130122/15474_1 /TAXON_ID=285029 /ORGANISM="Togula jolla, Strain CCCM 725" /LENGTH=151 /DNA_ID=CAMNT_0010921443 /DNA_START=241 /DNA_END=692 /DNA_ORIENTATION=-